jgi:hypothetical protein
MKKDNLKKLFDYVDENEKASVEFQTVWRKAHRKSWKQRMIQSAGPNLAILLILLVITPILGHLAVNQNSSSKSAQSMSDRPSHHDYTISGKVYNFPNQIIVKGKSNLPEGTIISMQYTEKNGEPLLYEEKGTANSEGSFQIMGDRLDRSKDYVVKVIVYPDVQQTKVKKILGNRGQHFTDSSSGFTYTKDGNSYSGLRVLGLVNMDDDEQHVISEFLMPLEEFEAYFK